MAEAALTPKGTRAVAGSWRTIAIVATFAVAAVAGWRVVTLAMAEFFAESDPARAVAWRDDHPIALLNLAQRSLIEGRLDDAERLARRSLAANPLDGRAYRVLGNIAGLRGDRRRQLAMMDLAARHAPRDVPTRAWAAQIALEHRDAKSAVRHYDRMMRVAPDQQRAVFPVLMGLASIPEARDALVETLASQPPWRIEFLRNATDRMSDVTAMTQMFTSLRARGGISGEESAGFIGRLVRERRWDEAFVAWAGGLSPGQLDELASPMDGGFELFLPSSGPFDWLITRRAGVDARIENPQDGPGQALRVEFLGQRSHFRDVRQLLLLPAGNGYRLEWRSRFDDLQTARGLRWALSCADGDRAPLLTTEATAGTRPWHVSDATFDVAADCPAQWLTLELEARIPAESQARGTAWFDDVRVVSPPSVAEVRGGS